MSRQFTVSSGDVSLRCSDNESSGPAIVFLNGAFGTRRDWRRVLGRIGDRYRCITFDARGRGRSSQSREYSFAADLGDVAEVVAATGVDQLILAGWSHGAALAVRYAAEHPGAIAGLVLVDGAFPVPPPTDAEKQQALRLFKRLAPIMRVMSAFGASARMSATQAASLNIELRSIIHTLSADYGRLTCPVDFLVGSKRSVGTTEEKSHAMRAAVEQLAAVHPNVSLFRTVPASHTQLLRNYPSAVVEAIDDIARKAVLPWQAS
jgi:pimeloyl-ACP methyl ester carboxylesterase